MQIFDLFFIKMFLLIHLRISAKDQFFDTQFVDFYQIFLFIFPVLNFQKSHHHY